MYATATSRVGKHELLQQQLRRVLRAPPAFLCLRRLQGGRACMLAGF